MEPERTSTPRCKGEVVYMYAFDVASEIVLKGVGEILSRRPVPFEVRVDHTFPKDIPLYRPLAIEPPNSAAAVNGQPVRLLIRVYEVGVVTIAARVSVACDQLTELMGFHDPVLADGRSLDLLAKDLCTQVCLGLRECLVRGTPPTTPEAYTVFCLTELANVVDVPAWLAAERRAIAGLLTGTDPARLCESQVSEVHRLQRSFESSDGVVIDWDAALVVDLSGYVEDMLYVLELANLQLEEFRVMDQRLDQYLDRAYEVVGRRRLGVQGVSGTLLRELRRFRVDVAKLADEVTHITKFVGDWHLARVYLGARERFHLDQWRGSVEQRLGQLDHLYGVLRAEVNERRMLVLEVAIVILFIVDLLALFFWKH